MPVKKNNANKFPRPNFSSHVNSSITIQPGEARCHTVSYQLIRDIIIKRFEEYNKPNNLNLNKLATLQEAIKDLYNALNPSNIVDHYHAMIRKNPSFSNLIQNNKVETLIEEFNSQTDNLRPGDGVTNSSIGSALDFPLGSFKVEKLFQSENEYNWDYTLKQTTTLTKGLEVLIPNERANTIMLNVLDAMVYDQDFHIYTHGNNQFQSSDVSNIKTGNVQRCETPILLKLADGYLNLLQ